MDDPEPGSSAVLHPMARDLRPGRTGPAGTTGRYAHVRIDIQNGRTQTLQQSLRRRTGY